MTNKTVPVERISDKVRAGLNDFVARVRSSLYSFVHILGEELPRLIIRVLEKFIYDNWRRIRDWFVSAWHRFHDAVDWLRDKVNDFFSELLEQVRAVFDGIAEVLSSFWDMVTDFFNGLVGGLSEAFA